jgi:hypothetical protein
MSHRIRLLLAVTSAAFFCSLFAFGPGFDNGFWRDDFVLLERAEAGRTHPSSLGSRWVEPFNRPLAQLVFYVEYRLFGLDSGKYIVANTLWHVGNCALAYWLFLLPLGPQAAAGAALLFALGLGFYGKAVLWAANLPDLLATGFVLATGIAATRAQLARRAPERAAWMGFAGILFAMGLACKESAITALVMVAGLMWPHRRSLASVVRKIALLVVVAAVYVMLQLVVDSGIARVANDPAAWVALPVRALRLATLMAFPVQADSPLVATLGPLAGRVVVLVDQVRPALGVVLLLLAALWFWRGSGATRWLLASFLGFLLPFGLIHMPEGWLDIRYAYLPATCFCGLVAYGLRALWIRAGRMRRMAIGFAVLAMIAVDLTLVRRLEAKYDGFGRSDESQAQLRALQRRLSTPL